MHRALALVHDHGVGAAAQHSHRVASVGHTRDLDDFAVSGRQLLHQVCLAKLLGGDALHTRDGGAAQRLADVFNVGALDVLHHEDLLLGQEVQRLVVYGVAQDGFLDEQRVHAGLHELAHDVEDVARLLPQDAVDLLVVRHNNAAVHVGFGGGQAELDEGNLGVLHARGRTVRGVVGALGEHQAAHQARVLHRAAQLLHHLDVVQVYVLVHRGVHHGQHRVHRQRGEQRGVL
mmetsp:Transcript_27947/g.70123  ORF Transcript_27947/g.70123 Transcript_27947/m.70123 type:complete len:232 (+) Transcript_27947:424-1119(+)